jgi:hypothetical protein
MSCPVSVFLLFDVENLRMKKYFAQLELLDAH